LASAANMSRGSEYFGTMFGELANDLKSNASAAID
jgi:hypothetical protein